MNWVMDINKWVIVLCLLLAIVLIVLELKRNNRNFLFARISAILIMCASLVLLIVPLYFNSSSLQKSRSYELETEVSEAFLKLEYALQSNPEYHSINIKGYGLTDKQLRRLSSYSLSFKPKEIESGFIFARWRKKLEEGQPFEISGSFSNPRKKKLIIVLKNFDNTVDSVFSNADPNPRFQLKANINLVGRVNFELLAITGKDTLAREPVPFEVMRSNRIRASILAAAPDFEYKFLKDWLVAGRFDVHMRSRTSKDKFSHIVQKSSIVPTTMPNELDYENLDLIIADENEVNSTFYQALKRGLGGILHQEKIKRNLGQVVMAVDSLGNPEITVEQVGKGRLVRISNLTTYQMSLAGEKKKYAEFWTSLIDKALAKKSEAFELNLSSFWSTVGVEQSIVLNLPDTNSPTLNLNGKLIPLAQNLAFPLRWSGVYWPELPGWNKVDINNDISWIYHFKETEWLQAKQFERLMATQNFVKSQQKHFQHGERKFQLHESKPLNLVWPYLGLLTSLGFLWWESRKSTRK